MSVLRSRDLTYALLWNQYFWKGRFGDSSKWLESCLMCSTVERKQIAQILQTILTKPPFDIVASDIMGPLTNSPDGHKYPFNFIDLYTSWPEVTQLKTQELKN